MENNVLSEPIHGYWENKEITLKERSALILADKLCDKTPLLIIHGSSDRRVLPIESLVMVHKLYQYKHPTRFILYEGADHGINAFRYEKFAKMKRHFDYYVRDHNSLPNMEPHGR